MYQTYAPFLEVYVRGQDLLRSSDGKPRNLISFTHTRYQMGGGLWELEIFDPDYVNAEELLLGVSAKEGTTSGEEGGDPESYEVTQPAMFRYGYVSQDGKVITVSPLGEEYFFATINQYRATYQPNGTLLSITGQTLGYVHARSIKEKRSFYAKNIYTILKEICELLEWEFVPLGETEPGELAPEKQPTFLSVTNAAIDSTEEQEPTVTMEENETYYQFIQRICNMARSNDPKFGDYVCYLQTRTKGKTSEGGNPTPEKPVTYLYFGPYDAFKGPVRKYVYMRDPTSDVISFTPNVAITVAAIAGASSGVVIKGDDPQRGEPFVHQTDHANLDMKTHRTRRPPVGVTASFAEMRQFQEGLPEQGEDTLKRPEGGVAGPTVLAAPKAADIDAPVVEMSTAITNPIKLDHAAMNWWLGLNRMVNSATLEIFGDPSPELDIGNNVIVVYFVPTDNKEFRVHWITKIWGIIGITHSIQGGTYITQLELGTNGGGLDMGTRQAWNAMTSGMDPGAMGRAGG